MTAEPQSRISSRDNPLIRDLAKLSRDNGALLASTMALAIAGVATVIGISAIAAPAPTTTVSVPERAAFQALIGLGLRDAFRLFEQEDRSYSWWDYRMGAFRRNFGLRIDHLLLSPPLVERCVACYTDKEPRKLERPSDHTPVVVELQ